MCGPSVSEAAVKSTVKAKLDASEAFTSACVSHPLIAADKNVRHFDVSQEVKRLWRHNQMTDPDGAGYLRTLISVYPDGPGSTPAQAYLYYPDNGFDPHTFTATSRVLIRNQGDDQDGVIVSNTDDGSSVSKQCQIQQMEQTLNVPRFIIKALGWNAGDAFDVTWNNGAIIRQSDAGKQKIDKEGRIRLHGTQVAQLGTNTPTALLVEPDSGDKYIQISALAQVAAPVTPDDTDDADAKVGRGISVWDDD